MLSAGSRRSGNVLMAESVRGHRCAALSPLSTGQDRGRHDLIENARAFCAARFFLVVAGDAQNIGDRNALAFTCELIATARTADAIENAFVHESLQHWLQMARWQIVSRCEFACRNGSV